MDQSHLDQLLDPQTIARVFGLLAWLGKEKAGFPEELPDAAKEKAGFEKEYPRIGLESPGVETKLPGVKK